VFVVVWKPEQDGQQPERSTNDFQDEFDSRLPKLGVQPDTIPVPRLHKHHWQRFLVSAGSRYGKDAQYALDGFYLENKKREKLLVLCHLRPGGLGGEVKIHVGGRDAADRIGEVKGYLKQFFPGGEPSSKPDPAQALGQRAEIVEVFISYALEPRQNGQELEIPPGYEVPVDAIEEFLRDKPVKLIRDKSYLRLGTSVKKFMRYGATRPHVIVVHSDKYWRSPYCIFELWNVMDELRKRKRKLLSVVIPVEHLESKIGTRERLHQYLKYWRRHAETPSSLGWEPQELKDRAASLLRDVSTDLDAEFRFNLKWEVGEEKVLAAIAKRLKLPSRKGKGAT
jgi:hypothetical protein